jgi:hypothetical protein
VDGFVALHSLTCDTYTIYIYIYRVVASAIKSMPRTLTRPAVSEKRRLKMWRLQLLPRRLRKLI